MSKQFRQLCAVILILTLPGIAGRGSVPAYGAEASVEVDETMYVNLDYYGKVSNINVVKGCNMNGLTTYTDYGTYQKVTNMSDQAVPVLGEGRVVWVPEYSDRFYFKGQLEKEQVALPWNFDVSYKLNGSPVNADQLAGASGLVEIHIKAEPNVMAREYDRNNMLLTVMMPVELEACYSVEAENSQMQTIGNMTMIMFTALPGEDGDYTVRIGSSSFETTGVVIAMIPGTVEDLKHIKDLKEARDTWKQAGDDLYNGLEMMAQSVEEMRGGVDQSKLAMGEADSARREWSGSRNSILGGNDQMIQSLTSVSGQMEVMIPHIRTVKESSETLHNHMGDIVDILEDMQEPVNRLSYQLTDLSDETDDIAGEIPKLMELMQNLIILDAQLQASEQIYITQMGILSEHLSLISEDYIMDDNGEYELSIPTATASSPGGVDADELLKLLSVRQAYLADIAGASQRMSALMVNLLEDTADAARYSADLTDSMDLMISEVTALNNAMDAYYPELQKGLDDTKELLDRSTNALNSGISTMTIIQDTLKDSSESLDRAARDGIRSNMELLDKSLSILDSTAAMRRAGHTMKDIMDAEWDKFDTDNRFLYMDPDADKLSFTSNQNGAVNTLQIILRTEEISLDDVDDNLDAEPEAVDIGPWQRICNLLIQMVQAVIDVFEKR